MKCLPTAKLQHAQGNVVHDWHAEISAIRSLNRFLLNECAASLARPHISSPFLTLRSENEQNETEFQAFGIRNDVQIHMYCSEAPCGDASMELVMDAQEDATPWTSPPPTVPSTTVDEVEALGDVTALRGRSHFGLLGAVRLKPSRPDAPPTLSKSCTDKLALAQCTSLLSSLTSLLISPRNAYLTSLVLPRSQYVEPACHRAFGRSGRMNSVTADMESKWSGGYAFRPFDIRLTSHEFKYSRRSPLPNEKAVPSNLSAIYTPHFQETLIGGVLQGRKQFDPRGASRICRRSMWKALFEVVGLLATPTLVTAASKATYREMKQDSALAARRQVKEDVKREALKGWIRNTGDEDFTLTQAPR